MYMCCCHCQHTGNFAYEQGHKCLLHDVWIDYNNLESVKLMFKCTDCELRIEILLELAKYCKNISVTYEFDEFFTAMNNINVIINDEEEWNHGFYKDIIKAYKVAKVTNNHINGYKILFDGFPVFRTTRIEEINFILDAIGLLQEHKNAEYTGD